MANFHLFCSSIVFLISIIGSNYIYGITKYNKLFTLMSYIAAITSILNHHYHNFVIRIIDRVYISIYTLYLFNLINWLKLTISERMIFIFLLVSGVIAILTAIRVRYLFENVISNSNKEFILVYNKCTLIHLYSHIVLIIGVVLMYGIINRNTFQI